MYIESNQDEEKLAKELALELVRKSDTLKPLDILEEYTKAYGEILEELKRRAQRR